MDKNDELLNKLNENIELLKIVNSKLSKNLSRSYQFKLGLWRAFTSALGATLGIAIIILILREVINRVDFIPILQELLMVIIETIPQSQF